VSDATSDLAVSGGGVFLIISIPPSTILISLPIEGGKRKGRRKSGACSRAMCGFRPGGVSLPEKKKKGEKKREKHAITPSTRALTTLCSGLHGERGSIAPRERPRRAPIPPVGRAEEKGGEGRGKREKATRSTSGIPNREMRRSFTGEERGREENEIVHALNSG